MIDRSWLKTVIEGARLVVLSLESGGTDDSEVSEARILEQAGTRPPRSEAERLLLLGVTADVTNKRSAAKRGSEDVPFGAVVAFLNTNSRNPTLTRLGVARALGISESWLAHGLKQATGQSFKNHLNHIRVIDAERLLQHSDHSLKHVALTVGLRSESALSKLFRHRHNVTPGAWRRKTRMAQGTTQSES